MLHIQIAEKQRETLLSWYLPLIKRKPTGYVPSHPKSDKGNAIVTHNVLCLVSFDFVCCISFVGCLLCVLSFSWYIKLLLL